MQLAVSFITIAIMDPEWPFPAADLPRSSTWPAASSLEDINDNSVWRPHPSLDKVLVEVVAKAVCDCNHNYLFSSRSDENYLNPETAYDRQQNWAMSKGFAVVQRSKKASNAILGTIMRVRWQYIYYDIVTANKRDLEDHVERNEEGKIIS
jgi:hypothetical protein